MQVLGYTLSDELPEINLSDKSVISTLNPHSYCVAKEDVHFHNALLSSDILIPDGIGIVFAARILGLGKLTKTAGADLHVHFLERANEQGLKIFYLGASDQTLSKIRAKMKLEYPNILVSSFSPPYSQKFTVAENSEMIDKINKFEPSILFVGMTAPKQEKWVFENKSQINVPLICSIGAVFDFYAGTVKRPHKIWINLGLEWLVRFIGEPRRLFKRNFVSSPKFVYDVLKKRLSRQKTNEFVFSDEHELSKNTSANSPEHVN